MLLADALWRTFLLPSQELFAWEKLRLCALHVFLSDESTYLPSFCLIKLLESIFPLLVNCYNPSWKALLKHQWWASISFTDHWLLYLSTLHNECLIVILLKHPLVTIPEDAHYLPRSLLVKLWQIHVKTQQRRKCKVMRACMRMTWSG